MSEPNDRSLPRRIGAAYTVAAMLVLLGLLAWLADDFLDARLHPNRDLESRRSVDGAAEVVLYRNRGGHYVAPGTINGEPATFLVDTGATLVAVDEVLAARMGLAKGVRWPLQTANGTTEGWRTLLGSVTIGDITRHAVPAVIMPATGMEEILLGMSFLQRVEMHQRDGVLVLRAE